MARIYGEELAHALIKEFPRSTCTHLRTIPAKGAHYGPWPTWIFPPLRDYLMHKGITRLYTHQYAAAEAIHAEKHTIITTGTASGKTLCYQIPVLSHLAFDSTACALYLSPTKALGFDQVKSVADLVDAIHHTALTQTFAPIMPASYDGDTQLENRRDIRQYSRYILTNPDMLHAGILPAHKHWIRFLRNLRYIIVDEAHSYRGVFGAHVAIVLRRLRRICAHYGSYPLCIVASATSRDPCAHASTLLGFPADTFTHVSKDDDGSPHGARTIVLWQPQHDGRNHRRQREEENLPATMSTSDADCTTCTTGTKDLTALPPDSPTGTRASVSTLAETAAILAWCVAEGATTLAFTRSRAGAEYVAQKAIHTVIATGHHSMKNYITSYRAGYTKEERHRIENDFIVGKLRGIASTNALELGIDVGGLDVVLIAGFPGTIASFWQQAGRSGRRGQGSLIVFIARNEPLDNYLVHHPEALLGQTVEAIVFTVENPHILAGHLLCAASELPLRTEDFSLFSTFPSASCLDGYGRFLSGESARVLRESPTAIASNTASGRSSISPRDSSDSSDSFLSARLIHHLAEHRVLRARAGAWFPGDSPTIHDCATSVSLRGSRSQEIYIMIANDGTLLGTIDADRAPLTVHPGAVYVHRGKTYIVDSLDLDAGLACVHAAEPHYYTIPQSVTEIEVLPSYDGSDLSFDFLPGLTVHSSPVRVTRRVTGFSKKYPKTSHTEIFPLDMPESQRETRSVFSTISPGLLESLGIEPYDLPGTLHAVEHAAIGLLPLITTCDRSDLGGLSTTFHPSLCEPTIFVYDNYPGGAGFSDYAFSHFREWIHATYNAVHSCTCDSGCPACIHSPTCGNGNEPLSKSGALTLLSALADHSRY